MRHVAVQTQQLIPVAEALPLGIHQQEDRTSGMIAYHVQYRAGQLMRQLYADGRGLPGADEGHLASPYPALAGDQQSCLDHFMAVGKELIEQACYLHLSLACLR